MTPQMRIAIVCMYIETDSKCSCLWQADDLFRRSWSGGEKRSASIVIESLSHV